MRVKVITTREFEIEVKNPVVAELDNYWRTHDGENMDYEFSRTLTEKVVKEIEEITGLSFGDKGEVKEVITGIYAMDGEAILEY